MRRAIAEIAFSIAFFQIALTPLAFTVWGMDWSQYLAWSATNALVSPVLGPTLARLHRYVFD